MLHGVFYFLILDLDDCWPAPRRPAINAKGAPVPASLSCACMSCACLYSSPSNHQARRCQGSNREHECHHTRSSGEMEESRHEPQKSTLVAQAMSPTGLQRGAAPPTKTSAQPPKPAPILVKPTPALAYAARSNREDSIAGATTGTQVENLNRVSDSSAAGRRGRLSPASRGRPAVALRAWRERPPRC